MTGPRPTAETPVWVHRTGWGFAHTLDTTIEEEEWFGVTYVKTTCGIRVRSSDITAAGFGDRCKTCTKRSTP